MTTMNQLFDSTMFFGGNAPFVEELYETYLDNPTAVPAEWRDYFDRLAQMPGYVARDVPHAPVVAAFAELGKDGGFRPVAPAAAVEDKKQVSVLQLINAHRILGTRWAELDPLKRMARPAIQELELSFYGFSDADLNHTFNAGSFKGTPERATLGEIVGALRQTYCSSVGVEYMYMSDYVEKRWLQERLETIRSTPAYNADQKKRILERLTAAETLERYLHTRYVGQKRFSLEGGESLIVAMDETVRVAGGMGVDEVVIGMAHRGRLNVLVNTLGKTPSMLFAEFEGKKKSDLSAGDVKYHMGFSSDVSTPGGPCHLTLAFNPSHLEIVNPVVEGSVYARQVRRGDEGKCRVLPVLIHGDSAVAGQGVNQETLNFAQTRGYGTGGTLHIVVNNQIGFTTSDPRDYRSGHYCTDIFKMADAPIFHVNGDDPEAVALVTQIAVEFRHKFKKDVVVDIICFRKLGHNEQDEPMVTQPLMYKIIAKHPGTRKLFGDKLIAEGVLPADGPDRMIEEYREHLDKGELLYNPVLAGYKHPKTIDWTPFLTKGYIENCDTTVPIKELKRLSKRLTTFPEGFVLQSRVKKIVDDRAAMGEGKLPVRLGHGREPGLRFAAGFRLRCPHFRRGCRARHLLPPPCRLPRPGSRELGRRHLSPAEEPAGKAVEFPLLRFGAVRRGGSCLRVRLCLGQSLRNGDLGSAVRRLRERRPGRDRPVHRFRRSQVGPRLRSRHAAAARLRRAGAGALLGPPRTLHAGVCRDEHGSLRAEQRRPGLPHAASPGAAQTAQAADRHVAQVAAAPQGRLLAARGSGQRLLPDGHR